MTTSAEAIIYYSIHYLQERLGMVEDCLSRMTEEMVWEKPNPVSNSMGNLVLHLCGNIRQYVIAGLGGAEDDRRRDDEFFTRPARTTEELKQDLRSVIIEASAVIRECSEDELLRMREVQGYNMNGVGILIHVVEHLSYHTGQIAYYTKLKLDEDLGFYAGRNLNTKNK